MMRFENFKPMDIEKILFAIDMLLTHFLCLDPAMMQPQGMEQKNFQALFKSEKENYEILNYKFKLDDAEDAFLAKYQKKLV